MWDALVERVEAYYGERFGSAASLPVPTSLDELAALALHQIEFTIADPTIVKVRKVLAQEQFRDERMARLASLHFMDGIVELYAQVFRAMMDAGNVAGDFWTRFAIPSESPDNGPRGIEARRARDRECRSRRRGRTARSSRWPWRWTS